ncbi:MAG: phospholipase D-like domain-containing protein [Bacteroidia bacterium]
MKKILFLIITLAVCAVKVNAQTIADARALGVGQTVTLTGIALNGPELGVIRYLQDTTAGIAIYDAGLSNVNRGDQVTVTGVLTDYNGLLEMNPATTVTINSTGNPLPAPLVLTPLQVGEPYEGELVEIDNVTFTGGGGAFALNTNYNFTSNGETGQIRITGSANSLIGSIIPTGTVNLVAIASQFTTTYQLLPRDLNDITNVASIYMITNPTQTNTTTTGFDVNWTTNISGSTYIMYGKTPLLELGQLNGTGGVTNHVVSITGANPSDIFYVQAFSVNGTDTAFSTVKLYATTSASTGDIKVYFNKYVDTAVALPGNNGQTLVYAIDDTLIAYINRAKYTIDLAIYSFDNANISNMTAALNDAYTNRSVRVRIVSDGSNANAGLSTLVAGIDHVASPTSASFGIMHNKFMVIDADAPDPNDAILWTGSTNLTDNQINTDANSVIIFQDQSIARGYKLEFQEMWGDTGAIHSSINGKFGPNKKDNTPHEYLIGGTRVEQYFSPSDGTNSKILNCINSADYDLEFAILTMTRTDLAYAISNRISAGVFAAGMLDDSTGGGAAFNIMYTPMQPWLKLYAQSGLLHHKYLIVDQDHAASDPLVLAGSHNWSNSAEQKNDENTVVIHDQNIANQYYQEFVKRFNGQGGAVLSVQDVNAPVSSIITYPNPNDGQFKMLINLKKNADVNFAITDIIGRKIYTQSVAMNNGSNEKDFDLHNFSKGIYMVNVSMDNYSTTLKMIVE